MRKTTIFLMLAIVVQISYAQKPEAGLRRYHLKGNVKQLTYLTYTTVGPAETTTVDTLSRPEKRIIEFDTNGNITKETLYSENGSVKSKLAYNYPDDKTIVINYFDPWDGLISQRVDKYDKNGLEIESTSRNESGVTNRFVFRNNKYGQLIEQYNYIKNDNLLSSTVSHYNDRGQKIDECLFQASGKQYAKCLISNDSLKNSIHKETFDMNGKSQSILNSVTNQFDQNGNWQIEELETFYYPQHGGKMTEKILTKRKIEYY